MFLKIKWDAELLDNMWLTMKVILQSVVSRMPTNQKFRKHFINKMSFRPNKKMKFGTAHYLCKIGPLNEKQHLLDVADIENVYTSGLLSCNGNKCKQCLYEETGWREYRDEEIREEWGGEKTEKTEGRQERQRRQRRQRDKSAIHESNYLAQAFFFSQQNFYWWHSLTNQHLDSSWQQLASQHYKPSTAKR